MLQALSLVQIIVDKGFELCKHGKTLSILFTQAFNRACYFEPIGLKLGVKMLNSLHLVQIGREIEIKKKGTSIT